MRHAAAALARAPLGALLLSGCAVRDEPDADEKEALDEDAENAENCEPHHDQAAFAPAQQLLVLESSQSAAGAAYCASAAFAPRETWDLLRAADAHALAACGAPRLRARLAAACPAFAAVSAAELASALAVAASASAPPRRGSPLHAAARVCGDAAHVTALLALGARADARDVAGATPLFVAAEAGADAACAALLAAGAALETRTTAGEGAAYIAALKGRTDAARVLLAAAEARRLPADALANIDGWTPLMAAAVAGRAGMLQLCTSLCGGLDGTNRFGQTALHLAARRGSDELCELLVRAGASARVRDERGAAPADVAARHGHAALAASLKALAGPGKKERRRALQRQDATASV
jgi:ankyrin repeat protein